ncbi:MAG: hypothetical protein L3J56_02295 [Bacteroidales bacterium]|nr:hypothetical protein [Bacteroidales bacterium]
MKTSKIILISIFASILIWITAVFLTATTKIKKLLKENGFEQRENPQKVDRGKTLKLENFSVISVSGKGELTIEQADENSFQYFSEEQIPPKIKNDTLFLSANKNGNYINTANLKTIILKDKVEVYINDIKADTLNIRSIEKTETTINNLSIKVLNILMKDKSSIKLFDLNGNNIETNLVLKDKSKIYINKSDNLNLGIKKDNEARLEISN